MPGRMPSTFHTLSCFFFYNGPIGKALLLFYHKEAKIGRNYGVVQGRITISGEPRI